MYLSVASKGSLRQRHTHVTLGETRRGGSQLQIDHLPFNSRLHSHVLLSNIPLRKPQSSQNPVLSILLFPPHIFHSPWSVHSLPIQIRATLIIRNRGSLASLRQTYLTLSLHLIDPSPKSKKWPPSSPTILISLPAGKARQQPQVAPKMAISERPHCKRLVFLKKNPDRRCEMVFP